MEQPDILTPDSAPAAPIDSMNPMGAMGSGIPITQFALREYFDNWQPDMQDQDAMNAIATLAHDKGITSKGDLFQLMRDVEMKLGAQNNRPRAILKYLQILHQIEDLTKVKNSFERT